MNLFILLNWNQPNKDLKQIICGKERGKFKWNSYEISDNDLKKLQSNAKISMKIEMNCNIYPIKRNRMTKLRERYRLRCVYDKCRLIYGSPEFIVFGTLYTSTGELSIDRGAFWLVQIDVYKQNEHCSASSEKCDKSINFKNLEAFFRYAVIMILKICMYAFLQIIKWTFYHQLDYVNNYDRFILLCFLR